MKKYFAKLNTDSGYSVMETICTVGIICVLVLGVVFGVSYYRKKAAQGTDRLNAVTAKNLASVNINNTGAVLETGTFAYTVGYYDDESNSIVSTRPKGYNKSTVMTIDGVMYTGSPNTMVIRITNDNGTLKLEWVEDH